MSIPYEPNTPIASDAPSKSQGEILQNFISINSIMDVDLNTFGSNFAGKHKQINLPEQKSQGAQTNPASVIHTTSGSASSVSDLIFKNQNASFLLPCVRAFGYFTTSDSVSPRPLLNGYNVGTITMSAVGKTYTIALTAGCATGTSACVIATVSKTTDPAFSGSVRWSISGSTLTLVVSNDVSTNANLTFVVMQA